MSFIQLLLQLLPYFAAAALAFYIAVQLLRQETNVPGRFYFGSLMLAVTWWAFFNAVEIASDSLAEKIVYANLQYLAIVSIPVLMLRFVVAYTNFKAKGVLSSLLFRLLLWIVPLTTAVFIWLDPILGLVRTNFELVRPAQGFAVLHKDFGPWFLVHTVYSYILLTLSAVFWVARSIRTFDRASISGMISLFAIFFPWIGNFMYISGINPWAPIDPTTPAFALMGLVLLYNLKNFRFLSLLPVARETLMENWGVPLLVFDDQNCLAFANKEARERWKLDGTEIGRKRTAGIPRLGWLPPSCSTSEIRRTALVFMNEETESFWEADERPLHSLGKFRGSVMTLHDVTTLRVSERELQTINNDLENRVRNRTAELEESNKRLSEELEYRRQTEHQLFYYSLHDPLTGLANRSLLLSRLAQSLERYKRSPELGQFGIIFLNFNGFKQINDTFGHAMGDEFLRVTAQRLLKTLRTVDTIARYSGDEFVMLLDSVKSEEEFLIVADRLEGEVESPITLDGANVMPSCRLGLVFNSPEYKDPEDLIRDAEIALQKSKNSGFGSCVLFHPRFREDVQDRLKLREELNKAIVNNELSLIYQPIVDLKTHELQGWEALSRWNHPTRGPISPGVFIPLAEESGTIYPLGLWVLRESAKLFRRLDLEFPNRPKTFVAVNVSARQLIQPDFCEIVLGVLEREGLPFERLSLEITENALIENSEAVIPVLQKLKEAGIGIKLDDFGTGYSSLHYLHRLPVDTIKIDRSFISDLTSLEQTKSSSTADSIVRSIIRLAEELNINVIAEGVETVKQFNLLKTLNCPMSQGFLFSSGLTDQKMLQYFQEWNEAKRPFPNGFK